MDTENIFYLLEPIHTNIMTTHVERKVAINDISHHSYPILWLWIVVEWLK